MLNKFSRKLKKYATGWLVFMLFLLDGFFMVYLMPSIGASMTGTSANTQPLDLMFFYTPQTAYEMIAKYGDQIRSTYREVELTVDIAYPIVYTLLFSLLITWLFKNGFDVDSKMHKLNILPLGAWLFDLLENLGIVTMLSIYPSTPAMVAWLTTIFTMMKWLFVAAVLILIVIGIAASITSLFPKRKSRRKSTSHKTHSDGHGEARTNRT